MKTNRKKIIYKVDSCLEKIQLKKHNVCNHPSYRTVCNKPIVNRSLLAHDEYQYLLSTPKGYKWTGITPCYKKKKNNDLRKIITNDQRKRFNTEKPYKQENKLGMPNNLNKIMIKKKIKNKIKNGVNDDLKIENNIHIQQNIDDSSMKKLKEIKAQVEVDYSLKRKQSWLQDEKLDKMAKEKDSKYKSFFQAKQKDLKEILEELKKQNIKTQVITEKKKFEERVRLRKDAEKRLRIETLKQEAKKVMEEEQMWRKKINQEFAMKMVYKINLNNKAFCMIQNMESNKDKIKLKRQHEKCDKLFDKNKKNQIADFEDKIEKCDMTKSIVFKSYEPKVNITDFRNLNFKYEVKSYEHCVLKKHKNISRYKIPNVHCYSKTSLNTVVCRWKDEVNDMIFNMRKRRCAFIQRAKVNNMWKY